MTTVEIVAIVAVAVSLVSSGAAWTAIILNRKSVQETIRAQVNIAARNSRANVVSANRQRWIDAIRDDVAEFIATLARVDALKIAGSFNSQGVDSLHTEQRELSGRLVMLKARIRMRQNHTEDDHLTLLRALDASQRDGSEASMHELDEISRKIFRAEWVRLKSEASGINPFVKEAKGQREYAIPQRVGGEVSNK